MGPTPRKTVSHRAPSIGLKCIKANCDISWQQQPFLHFDQKQIMDTLRGPQGGTFMPKRVYDMNQKTEELHDFATGLLPDSNDAQKTIAKLEQKQINHFYILHEDSGLYACSKGRPNKEAVRTRLECPAKIMADLEELRDDFILNEKSQMLVMVSMATDEMIRLVAMYPDVWFMDTTAGKLYYKNSLFPWVQL